MKKILLATAIISMALFSYAQSGDPLRDKLDSIFKFINKSQIPNRIISGTFACVFKNSFCDTVRITDGRFDIKF